jgi:anti-sigma B factor antagonist
LDLSKGSAVIVRLIPSVQFTKQSFSEVSIMQSVLTRPEDTVIRPQGHVNSSNVFAFQDQLTKAMMSPGSASLMVDMSEVESLDSAALMSLVSTHTLAQRLNKRFSLCSLSAPARIIFELTQLDRAFEINDQSAYLEAA